MRVSPIQGALLLGFDPVVDALDEPSARPLVSVILLLLGLAELEALARAAYVLLESPLEALAVFLKTDISGGFVPAISVTVAIVLSLVSLVLLVYFIHHVSASIQAAHIVRVIAEDLEEAVPRLYPSETGEAHSGPIRPLLLTPAWMKFSGISISSM